MPHTCSEPNCTNNVFGGNFCQYHQFRRRMNGGDLFKRKAKKKASEPPKDLFGTYIPSESKRRKIERKRYSEQIAEFWEESVASKEDFCFFCGIRMSKRDNIHHLRGRTGDYYNDKQYWVNAHQKCHTECYHMMSLEKLEQEPWYDEWMERLKSKDYHSYAKELRKRDKSSD